VAAHHQFFSDQSQLYASARPTYPEELFDFLRVQCEDLDACWDCATGSGQAALALAEIFEHVEATDVCAGPLEHAPQHPRVSYSVQPAERTNFASRSFDLVTIAQALHWFDLERFWLEVDRVLKPGGVLAVWGYAWPHIAESMDAVLQEKLRDVIEPFWAPQNKALWDGYRDVEFPFTRIATPQFQLVPQWNLPQLLAYLGTWSATRQCLEAQGEDFFEHFAAALELEWGDPTRVRAVTMDFCMHVARKES
jgi:SAM-dependent methyltransferase